MFVVLSAVSAAVLVVGLGVPAWGADIDPTPTDAPAEVLPDTSTIVSEESEPQTIPPIEMPTGDFSNEPDPDPVLPPRPSGPLLADEVAAGTVPSPAESVRDFDPETAELVGRTEFDSTYENSDGTMTTLLSAVPENVEENGTWVPIETEVKPTGVFSWLGISDGAEVERHPLSPTFAETSSDDGLLTLSSDDHTIGFTLRDAADSKIVRDAVDGEEGKSHVEYQDVFPDTDLLYDVSKSSVKENFRLAGAPGASGRTSWTWDVDADGLTLHKTADGGVEFKDSAGELVFVLPAPAMWDSAVLPDTHNEAEPLQTTVLRRGNSWTLTISADRAWLNSPARVYPVMIDPTVAAGSDNVVSYRSDGFTSYDVQAGNSNNSNRIWRSIVHYNYEQFFGKQIIGAQLDVAPYTDSSMSPYGIAIATATQFDFDSVGQDLGGITVGDGIASSTDMRLQSKIAEYVRTNYSGGYFSIIGDESPNTFTYKHLETQIRVEWKNYPTLGSRGASSPANGEMHASTQTKLSVQGATVDVDPRWQLQYYFRVSTTNNPANDANAVYNSDWTASSEVQIPEARLLPNTTYYWIYYVRDSTDGYLGTSNLIWSSTWAFRTNDVPITSLLTAVPADKGKLVSTSPTLSVAVPPNPGARTLSYWFRVASGPDSKTGAIVASGWQSGTSWTVPKDYLEEGVSYTWTVLTQDQFSESATSWVGHFTVDPRIASPGASPTDTAGPVSVNLANGNASLQFTSPTVSTLGGPLGVSFTYNSQKSANTGLTGTYYNATDPSSGTTTFDFNHSQAQQRTDAAIDFNWSAGSPTSASSGVAGVKEVVSADKFLVRWTGYITLEAGTHYFGARGDDGFRAWIGTTQIINSWASSSDHTVWADGYPVDSTSILPFTFEYYENTGDAKIQFAMRSSPSSPGSIPVPTGYFSKVPQLLPTGWGGSSILAGTSSSYVRAEVSENAIKLVDMRGGMHAYTKKSAGGYDPPLGEYGVVALSAEGSVTFTDESGIVYAFNKDGTFASATSPQDVKKPTAPVVIYRSGGRIDKVADPLSVVDPAATTKTYGRFVQYFYNGDSQCPATGGFVVNGKATGLLCRITYPDTTVTKLSYDSNGFLMRIENPGGELTTFSYDDLGLLTTIRSPLMNRWLAVGAGRVATPQNAVTIGYSGTKVSSVTLPAPDGATAAQAPAKTYTYGTGSTFVDVAGLTVPSGGPTATHAMKATFDPATYQMLSTVSAEGLTAQAEWNAKDQSLSSTNAQGLKSTTIYDIQDRVTDTYGPAPAACFGSDRKPITPCAVVPARTETKYDEGLKGLSVAYFDNKTMTGSPKAFSLGLSGVTDGSFSKAYGTAAPVSGIASGDNWAMRATGILTFPSTGTFQLNAYVDDAVRVYLNDVLVIDNWTWHTELYASSEWKPVVIGTEAQRSARIRIDYAENTGNALAQLQWITPTMAAGTFQAVPGSALTPDYGLVTSTKTYDSAPAGVAGLADAQVPPLTTSTGYGDSPWLGLARTSTVDPSGTNPLTTTTTYESSTLYNRPLFVLSPADAGASTSTNGTSNDYWSGATTVARCGVPAGANQFGMLQRSTVHSATGDVVTEYVYDVMGRAVGTKKTGDTDYSCTTFDPQGRPASSVINGPGAARTVTYAYSTGGDPLTTSVTDGLAGTTTIGMITTVVDLLGRTKSSTDVWGTVTTNAYNRLGQVTSTAITADGQTFTTGFTYDYDGRVKTVTDQGKTISVSTYSGSVLASVSYPAASASNAGNGTSLTLSRDAAGRDTGLAWQFAGSASAATDTVVRSQSGRILRDTTADPGTTQPYVSTYTFDTVGRLSSAAIPGHALTYGYLASGGCSSNPTAGANGNRTSTTDTPTGGAGLKYSTSYCYGKGDVLQGVTETVTGAGSAPASMVRPGRSLAPTDIVYDARGNITKLGNQTFTYDSSDRHATTTVTDPAGVTTVSYLRDVSGAVVARTETAPGVAPVTFRYSGPFVLADTGAGFHITQRTLTLTGGVVVSLPVSGAPVWSYPNIHGDITWTADAAGARTGFFQYDPFGQPIDPVTKVIGSAVADESIPDTMPGNFDPGWVGSKGKGYEHAGSIAIIEMGVRMYSPWLGRFLAADPVAGGNTSWYNYPNDPINSTDLDGRRIDCGVCSYASTMAGIAASNGGESSAARNAGWTPHGFNGVGEEYRGRYVPNVPRLLLDNAPYLARKIAFNLGVAANWAGLLSAAADIAPFVPPHVKLGMAGVSVGLSYYSAVMTCAAAWGSSDCSIAGASLAFGVLTLGAGTGFKAMKPELTPFANQFYSGGLANNTIGTFMGGLAFSF